MLRFCQTLKETAFDNSLLVSNSILQKYIKTRTFYNSEGTIFTIPITSRSCQTIIKEEAEEWREIFVAPSSAARINDAKPLYEPRNTVLVLSCLNEICTLEGTFEVPNLEDNFPVLGKRWKKNNWLFGLAGV